MNTNLKLPFNGKMLPILVAGWLVFTVIGSSATIIDTGEAGVVLRLGKYSGIMTEGFNFKVPFMDNVVKMDIRDKNSLISTEVSSKDMQTIKIKLNLIYALDGNEVGHIYQKYRTNVEKILIQPTLLEIINSTVAEYDIEEFVSNRSKISKKISDDFSERIKGSGVLVKSINLVEHNFNDKFDASITEKKIAQQNAEKAKYDLERVKLEAEAQKVKANTLTPMILQERAIDKWDGKLPQVVGSGAVPFVGDVINNK